MYACQGYRVLSGTGYFQQKGSMFLCLVFEGRFSDIFFPPRGNPPLLSTVEEQIRFMSVFIVCNSARITIQKTICRKVQIAPRNDIGRQWDLFLLKLSVDQRRAQWTRGWRREPLGAASCTLTASCLPACWQIRGDSGTSLLLMWRRQKLLFFWIFEGRIY